MAIPYYTLQTTSKSTGFISSGYRTANYAEAAKEARRVSKKKWVRHVAMTRVHEETEGVWRNGRRS